MTSDRRSAARPSQWGATVHVFSVEWVIFILSLTTLATEQTKNTSLLAARWRARGGCGRENLRMESTHFIVSVTICSIVGQSVTLSLLHEVDA